MNKLNASQTGKAAELRFCSLVILGSGGIIEMVPPLADDERRDFELHLKHRFGRPISMQIKSATTLTRRGELAVRFLHGQRRPVDPAYWFFAGYLDLQTLDFRDPLFLMPSKALRRGNQLAAHVRMSMKEDSRDQWVKYRVSRAELGARLARIMEQLEAEPEEEGV